MTTPAEPTDPDTVAEGGTAALGAEDAAPDGLPEEPAVPRVTWSGRAPSRRHGAQHARSRRRR